MWNRIYLFLCCGDTIVLELAVRRAFLRLENNSKANKARIPQTACPRYQKRINRTRDEMDTEN